MLLRHRRCGQVPLALAFALTWVACSDDTGTDTTTLPPVVQCEAAADCAVPGGLTADCVAVSCDDGRCIAEGCPGDEAAEAEDPDHQ